MKKLLLTALAVLGMATAATATTWTIPMSGDSKPSWTIGTGANGKGEVTCQATVDGKTFDIAINQNTSPTKVDGIATATELRWYKSMTMTIKADGVTIRSVVFSGMYEDKCVSFTPSAATGGTVATNTTADPRTVTWTNPAGVAVFEATADQGQIRANNLIISDEATEIPDQPVDPTPSGLLNVSEFTANFGFTFEDGTLPEGITYVWTRDSKNNYMKASAWNKVNFAVEAAYLVSPVVDLAGLTNIDLTFAQCVGQFKDAAGTLIAPNDFLKLCVREEGGQWSAPIDVPSFPAYNEGKNFSSFADCVMSLDAYAGKKIQLGFRYSSTATTAGTWEIKSVKVTDRNGAGVENIAADADAPVEYFNLQGVRVAEPANGIFIRRQGFKATKVIL